MRTGNKSKISITHFKVAITVITALVIGVVFFQIQKSQALPSATDPGVYLSLIPDSPSVVLGQPVTISIYAHPNNHQVTAAKLTLNYNTDKFIASSSAIIAGPHLTKILPNCLANAQTCPAETAIDLSTGKLTAYLGVNCQESGCDIPPANNSFLLAKLNLTSNSDLVSVESFSLSNNDVNGTLTQIAALGSDSSVLASTKPTNLTLTKCNLPFDFLPDQKVNVIDIQLANNLWNTNISSGDYNGQFDITKDHQINILDLQQIANSWGQTCQ